MNQINSFEFSASLESLRGILVEKTIPGHLLAPFQALLKTVLDSGDGKSLSIYLSSDDDSVEARSYFAHALAKTLVDHVPSLVVVDCDFLNTGMAGVVPQKDSLGFLDFLLYGSSLGVVTQESPGGIRVIGAGSFPLTKKMPISPEAFEEAARRMATQSHLSIFCGPAEDDEGNVHPLAAMVDLSIYLSYARNFPAGRMDPFEEKMAAQLDNQMMSVRISGTEPAAAVSPPPSSSLAESADALSGSRPEEGPERPADEVAPVSPEPDDSAPPAAEFTGLPFEKKKGGSLIPKIVTYIIGAFLVVFLIWWVFITQRFGGPDDEPVQTARDSNAAVDQDAAGGAEPTGQQPSAGGEGDAGETSAAGDGQATAPGGESPSNDLAGEGSGTPSGQPAGEPDRTPEPSGGPETGQTAVSEPPAPAGSDYCIVDDFTSFGGKYLVHISSFRTITRAAEDVLYLDSKGFESCVVPVDLGSKGQWYRVYAGPMDTREEARELKIMLDELPRVTFTRITRAPGGPR